MAEPEVLFDVRDHVATVRINRPEVMNALSPETDEQLFACWQRVRDDDDVWFAVLDTVGGRAFCAGADMRDPRTEIDPTRPGFGGGLTGIGGSAMKLGKPLIGVVRGWAIGGGFELALACDILLAGTSARFSIPEARMGVLGNPLAVHRAMRRLPRAVALDLILTGRVMEAEEAARWGLISRLVPDEELPDALETILGELRAGSPLAIRASLAVAAGSVDFSLEEAERQAYQLVSDYLLTADYAEALAARTEKRPPQWRGH